MYSTQPDYAVTAPSTDHRTMEMAMNKRANWDQIQVQLAKLPPNMQNSQSKRIAPMKSLAELQQRKLEVISQLEKVVGKTAASIISNSATTQAKQDSSPVGGFDGAAPYYFCMGQMNTAPTFVRSDSILKAEDDYVPFDTPCVSKYGPISRMPKDNVGGSQTVQVSSTFGDNTISTPMVRRPVSAPSPVPSWYVTNSPNLQAALNSGHTIISPSVKVKDGYILHHGTMDSPSYYIQRMQDNPSKKLLDESQKVKLQLRNLEKKINDLKLASQGVTLNERERLTQELQLIEQGIFEKQKEVKLVRS